MVRAQRDQLILLHDGSDDSRLNTKLESQGLDPMTDLVKDFSNGVKLIQVSYPPLRRES